MKKVLVTGAAGTIGMHVIKYLLAEGKYEITALDLKNKKSLKKLKRYQNRINVLYADVCDKVLINALVKDQDIIIHLASTLPPIADMKKGLANLIDYEGTKNIVRAIDYYNPDCHLFFASTMSMYKDNQNVTTRSKIKLDEYDYFDEAKKNAEDEIKEKLKNYTIYRLPIVLGNPKVDQFIYHVKKDRMVSFITKEDAAYAFVRGIKYLNKINKQTYNVTSGEEIKYGDLMNNILRIYGLNFKYILNRLFIDKNFYSPICKDKDDLNDIISYRNDTLSEYYNRLRGRSKKRVVPKFFAKIFIRKHK